MTTPSVRTVLFDADGVTQHTPVTISEQLAALLGDRRDRARAFADDVFATEKPSLIGAADFRDDLRKLLRRWQITTTVDEVLQIWHRIDVVQPVCDMVRRLRSSGYQCALASNQNSVRAAFMSSGLGYDALFDQLFFSCDLGFAKPHEGYFAAVLERLDVAPGEVLFIDDKRTNVAAARSAGMCAERFEWIPKQRNSAELATRLSRHGVGVAQ